MMLYDVFYKNSKAFDRQVALPKAAADIDRAVNVNWDKHALIPVKKDGEWEWQDEREQKPYSFSPSTTQTELFATAEEAEAAIAAERRRSPGCAFWIGVFRDGEWERMLLRPDQNPKDFWGEER